MENKRHSDFSISAGIFIIFLVALAQFATTFPQYQLPPIQGMIMTRTGMNLSQYIQCYTAPMLPAVLLGLYGGLLVDRHGPKPVIGIGILVSGIGIILRCVSNGYPLYFISMALTGVAPALIFSSGAKIMGQWFNPTHVSLAVGFMMLGGSFANLIATATTAFLPSDNAAYLLNGFICVVSLGIWLIFMKNRPDSSENPQSRSSSDKFSSGNALKQVLRSKTIWLVSLCMLFIMGFYMTIASSAPSALESIGYSQTQASLLATALSIGSPVGCILGSALVIRSGRVKIFLFSLIAITVIIVPTCWQSDIPVIVYAALLLTGFCYGTCQVTIMAIPTRLPEIGNIYAGTAGGLLSTIQMLGSLLLPSNILVPLAGDSYIILFLLAALCLALSGIVCLCFPRLNFDS